MLSECSDREALVHVFAMLCCRSHVTSLKPPSHPSVGPATPTPNTTTTTSGAAAAAANGEALPTSRNSGAVLGGRASTDNAASAGTTWLPVHKAPRVLLWLPDLLGK